MKEMKSKVCDAIAIYKTDTLPCLPLGEREMPWGQSASGGGL